MKAYIKIILAAMWKFFKRHILRKKLQKYNFGLIPDKWDSRDILYRVQRPIAVLPPSTNRKNISAFPIRYDQGGIGSCVGNGVVAAFRRTLQVNLMNDFDASRLFAYYIAREDKSNDTGAQIRDAFKAINNFGLCSEKTWPYHESDFAKEPFTYAFLEALDHQSLVYERIYPVTKEAIMDAVSRGFPVVYGMKLYESFMSTEVARSGIVPIPKRCEEEVGGHCKVIFDYEPDRVIELNSWGACWGQNGVCEIP
jgi:C1A family cysteine protease